MVMEPSQNPEFQLCLQQARLAMTQSQPQRALHALAQASLLQPENLELYSLQAEILVQMGQANQALVLFQHLSQSFPQQSKIWLVMGNLYQQKKLPRQALGAYQEALKLEPQNGEVWSNLGWLHQQGLDLKAAESAYDQALKYNPDLAFAWNNLSTLKLESGDFEAAKKALERCLYLAPQYAPARVNQALLASAQGDYTQAQHYLQEARQLAPHLAEAWREEVCLLLDTGQESQAEHLLMEALKTVPQSAELHWLHSRLAWLKLELFMSENAFLQARILAPERNYWVFQQGLGSALSHFLSPKSQQLAYIEALSKHLEHFAQTPFALSVALSEMRYLPEMLWHLTYLGDQPFKQVKSLLGACILPPETAFEVKSASGPLRLGIVVTPGHEGIFNKLCAPLIGALDPQKVCAIVFGDLEHLAAMANVQRHDLPPQVLAAAKTLQKAELELIYHWEVGSDVLNYYLPWFCTAPVQFTGWGTPLTTGLPCLDFYLSDCFTEPERAQEHYSEELVLLPCLPLYMTLPEVAPLERLLLGLPQGRLYVCLQNPLKYSLEFIAMLGQLMQRDPEAHVVLLQSREPVIQNLVNDHLQKLPQEQLICLEAPVSRQRYLNILQQADVVLDTWQHSGGQSSDEALALGTPVVTLPGRSARTRLTLGRLKQLDVLETVADSVAEYLDLALALARAGAFRERIRAKLQHNVAGFLQQEQVPRQFEAALWQMAVKKGLRLET